MHFLDMVQYCAKGRVEREGVLFSFSDADDLGQKQGPSTEI